MTARERLTIDTTVARDYLNPERARHPYALELFDLFRAGEVELVTAPQGYRLDADGDLAEQVRAILAAENVGEANQLAYPSEVTYPGENLFPGAYEPGFADAWNSVVETRPASNRWPPGTADRFHVETHVLEKRDVFITDDGPLLEMCRLLARSRASSSSR